MSLLAVEGLALILFVALALIAGKSLIAAERNGVGVRGIVRRGARDGYLKLYDARPHGGDAEDPMHLHDELPPLPFRTQNEGEKDRPNGRHLSTGPGV